MRNVPWVTSALVNLFPGALLCLHDLQHSQGPWRLPQHQSGAALTQLSHLSVVFESRKPSK